MHQALLARLAATWAYFRRHAGPPLVMLLALLALWQVLVVTLDIRPFILPSPLHILSVFFGNFSEIAAAAGVTAVAFLGGFALACVVGLSLAVIIVASPSLGRSIYPLLIASQTIPTIAIAPLLIIWLGFGVLVKIVISAVIAFFPIVVSAVLGFRSVSPSSVDLMRSIPASHAVIFRKLYFPSALPTIFAGMRTASVLAVIGAVVGEFVAGGDGLASHIVIARSQFETDRVMADLLGLAILGGLFYGAIALAEHGALPWKRLTHGRGANSPASSAHPASSHPVTQPTINP